MTTTPSADQSSDLDGAQPSTRFDAELAGVMPGVRADLERLVRIPSVAFPAFDQAHVHESAETVAELLRAAGMPEVELVSARTESGSGAPAVIARRPAPPGAPTVMLYAHHDVQPPGALDEWTTPPFEPTERDGRLYGRGAADDKAGIMAHIAALRILGDRCPVGVTVFIEGEEEYGSPTFRPFLEQNRDKLAADVIVVADSANWRVGQPALTTGLRGLVDAVIEVRVLEHAVHSGMFGGPVLDALTLLSQLIATFHDEAGDVAITGLVVAAPPSVEMDEKTFRADSSVLPGVELAGTGSITSRLWAKPALSIIGIDAPRIDEASNTLVPVARAKVSLRIAPGQDPELASLALAEHAIANAPRGAKVTIDSGDEGKPFTAPKDTPAMRAARAAFAASWGVEPVDIGLGGSIPFIADLLEVYPEAQILVTGVEDPDSRAHGIDESLHLGDFERVCLAEALLLTELGQNAPGAESDAAANDS